MIQIAKMFFLILISGIICLISVSAAETSNSDFNNKQDLKNLKLFFIENPFFATLYFVGLILDKIALLGIVYFTVIWCFF